MGTACPRCQAEVAENIGQCPQCGSFLLTPSALRWGRFVLWGLAVCAVAMVLLLASFAMGSHVLTFIAIALAVIGLIGSKLAAGAAAAGVAGQYRRQLFKRWREGRRRKLGQRDDR